MWGPSVPFYDFLSVMDQELPGYAVQRSTKTKMDAATSEGRQEGKANRKEQKREKREKDRGERQGSGTPANPPSPHTHSEL